MHVTGSYCSPEVLPIMPALCQMLCNARNTPNYASIIGSSLLLITETC